MLKEGGVSGEKLLSLYSYISYGHQIKEGGMGKTRSTCGRKGC